MIFKRKGEHRDKKVLKHSFPTRRSADLHADECGLAGAVRAEQAEDFPGVHLEGDIVYSDKITEAAGQPARFHTLGRFAITLRSGKPGDRSEEHTSELQSLMRISYAVFFLKKTKIYLFFLLYSHLL